MLKKLAHYAQAASNNDMVTFTSSGFEAASTTKAPPQQLDQPTILDVDNSKPGQMQVIIKRVKKARSYDVRSGVMAGGTTAPTSWTITTFAHTRKPATITGLTSGATYALQVRAFGTAGFTGWSDPAIRMCT
jgi:hypothetical protein